MHWAVQAGEWQRVGQLDVAPKGLGCLFYHFLVLTPTANRYHLCAAEHHAACPSFLATFAERLATFDHPWLCLKSMGDSVSGNRGRWPTAVV